jgi:hypothetical protein
MNNPSNAAFGTRSAPLRARLLAVLLWWTALSASAQLQLYPLPQPAAPPAVRTARTEALTLPFFDDFSTTTTPYPDPVRWVPGGGTFVNNALGISPPSLNIVTFDGLRGNGLPYNPASDLASGATDTLTSQPVDLGTLQPRDSVYLSFFYQIKGLGELPDPTDSLRLQFRTRAGTWQTVWLRTGGPVNPFTLTVIPLRSADYFHAGFQFRFQTFGRTSGPFDTWHIDYVYLDRNRRMANRFIKDVALQAPPSPYFRRYAALPLRQYRLRPAQETADTVRTTANNLFDNNNFTTLRFRARELTTGQVLQNFTQPISENIPALSQQVKAVRPVPLPGNFGGTAARIRYTFDLLTTDNQNPSIPGVDLTRNDTISATATLDDYYAYDDGTAEYAAGLNQRLGRVAVRFVLNQPDAIRAIRLHLSRYRRDLSATTNFSIQIYDHARGLPGQVLHQQAFPVTYAEVPGGFVEFALSRSVAVRDTFFVGWQQLTEDVIAVGLDRNFRFEREIFYNLGTAWLPNTDLEGALLLRPVMGGSPADTLVTALPEEPGAFRLYPNPTAGPVRWNDDRFETLDVLDAAGRVLQRLPVRGHTEADLTALRPGVYLLRFSDDRRTVLRKLIRTGP